MFFLKWMTRDVRLEPRHFGPRLKATVKSKLMESVEGKCLGNQGFVVMVLTIQDDAIGKGEIEMDTGCVKYTINFQAIVYRPFRNEVIDAVVRVVHDMGFFADAGPVSE